ncbi:MAG: penicillin acylase family protein, partial [Chitinivibrionales bacterium]|nr:penicillin acylase family protein [Chitinivibrionales bacterium]
MRGGRSCIAVLLVFLSCMSWPKFSTPAATFDQRLASFPQADLPLQQRATIYWNENLIPFIDAATDQDCAFLLGLVHAHLRLSQMTLLLRASQGRLSESAGPFTIAIDQTIRILSLGTALDSMEQIMPETTRQWLVHYVKGINWYQDHQTKFSKDMKLLALKPQTWQVRDILLLGRMISADVNWMNWFQWNKLAEKKLWPRLWQSMIQQGFESITSFSADSSLLSRLWGGMIKSGSNALVISAKKSVDNAAMVASDPHLGLQLPNNWVIIGYRSPSFHCLGLTFPGIPMVLVGRNQFIAWAGTNMRSASSDLFALSEEQLAACSVRTEKIKVRWASDKTITVRMSTLGPILSDCPYLSSTNGRSVALRWIGHQPSDEYSTFLAINKAANWQEFHAAFKTYAVSGQNFLYADAAGHIGMVPAVRIPKRADDRPNDFILSGQEPSQVWSASLGPLDL